MVKRSEVRHTPGMRYMELSSSVRSLFWGGLLLILCCGFYLGWWVLAYRPHSPVRGMASGWLLLPALAFGLFGVVQIVSGNGMLAKRISPGVIITTGLGLYVLLLILSKVLFHRLVTTELLLIVGWTLLLVLEINALRGGGGFSAFKAVAVLFLVFAVAVVSMICYLRYYGLSAEAGYRDGMIPLILVMACEAVVSFCILF